MTKLSLAILSVITLTLSACVGSPNDYSSYRHLPAYGWEYNDTIVFVPESTDSIYTACMSVGVRHNNDYPYSNLWLEVTHLSHGTTIRDTLDLELASVYGRWRGKGFGPSYQFADSITTPRRFVKGDTVLVRHIMRVDTLPDIEQVGITVVSTF